VPLSSRRQAGVRPPGLTGGRAATMAGVGDTWRRARALDGLSRRGAVFGAALCALAVVAAACGGGSNSAGVAHVGATTTPTTALAGPSVTSLSSLQSDQLAFAGCMRSHGVPDYPDPNSQGGFSAPKGQARSDLDLNSSRFQAALKACNKLLPKGGPATPAQQAAVSAQALEFARCMRAHGVPGFPDPGSGPHRGYFVQAENGPLSPSNPQFARAQQTCRKLTGGIY
jgi:hypothetical protein